MICKTKYDFATLRLCFGQPSIREGALSATSCRRGWRRHHHRRGVLIIRRRRRRCCRQGLCGDAFSSTLSRPSRCPQRRSRGHPSLLRAHPRRPREETVLRMFRRTSDVRHGLASRFRTTVAAGITHISGGFSGDEGSPLLYDEEIHRHH